MSTSVRSYIRDHRYQLGIVAILLIATFLRFYRLDALPPGLHPDEAANGLDVFRILEHHDFRPFYTTNGGREALLFYLQAIPVALLGATTLALRLVPALIGVLAVGATYLWIRSWFGKRTAIIAAFLLAVSPWAMTISRDGFRAGLVALMVPLTLWTFTKALQSGSLGWYAAAGFSLGLGFYTYTAFYVLPLMLLLSALPIVFKPQKPPQWWPGLSVSLAVIVVTILPLAMYGIMHPGDLFGRAEGVSILNAETSQASPIQALVSSLVKTSLMFNFHGDDNYRHNLGGQPELNIFVGISFILGLLVCLTHMRRIRYSAMVIALLLLLLPAILSAEGSPHALRSIGSLPIAIGLAAIGIVYLLDVWRGVFPLNAGARIAGSSMIVVLLGLSAYYGYAQYFLAWANAPQTYKAYNENATSLAAYYNLHPFSGQRYAVSPEYPLKPVAYLTHNKSTYQQIELSGINGLAFEPSKAKEFSILSDDKDKVLAKLSVKYPKGKVSPHYSDFDGRELFIIYTVPSS